MRLRRWLPLTLVLTATACARPLPASFPGNLTSILARSPVQLGRANWLPDTPMITARYHMAAGVIGGRLITAGGLSDRLHRETEAYDPRQGGWQIKALMPSRRYLPASGVIGGKLYVAGGWDNGAVANLEAYDPVANAWEILPPMPEPVLGANGVVLAGELHVLGGVRNRALINSHFIYNPKARRWRREPVMPFKRAAMVSFALDDRIYCWGGWAEGSDFAVPTGSSYDGATGRWSSLPPMPDGRALAAVTTSSDKAYVLGGGGGDGWLVASSLVFDSLTRQWTQGPDMATARNGSAAAVFGSRLVVAGLGIGDDAPSVEYLDISRGLSKGLSSRPRLPQSMSKHLMLLL